LAPEHPYVKLLTSKDEQASVDAYVKKTASKLEIDRKAATEKTGVFTGGFAVHPLTNEKIPVWIADYVMMDYGTGAIMAVPGHDERDFEFAKLMTKNNPERPIRIPYVLNDASGKTSSEEAEDKAYTGEGVLKNSQFLDGLTKTEAIRKMNQELEKRGLGKPLTQYKLRDWLFSRQRYWGEPFPMVNFPGKGLAALPVNELPVALPEVADYQPSEKGEAPLARNEAWVNYVSPSGEKGRRETDTMPGSAGSSWYFLRFIDPHNSEAPFSPSAEKYWMPVDLYVGGPEHTVGHLLYARFWQKVMHDVGLTTSDEPFKKLAHQGMILGADGEKMSKSRGNVIPADSIRQEVGADAVRTFICFLGPMDKDKPWSPTGIEGVRRFLDRISRLVLDEEGRCQATPGDESAVPEEIRRTLHKTIKKVTDDIEGMSFNTAISAMMILVNELYKADVRPQAVLKPLAQLLMPFAPHLAEELWEKMGGTGLVSLAPWPQYDNSLVADDKVTLGVQVNGKMRGTISIAPDAPEDVALAAAKAESGLVQHLSGKNIEKVIYKAGKILNLIIK
jgi:leucyl-tRNA synthetase